MREKIIIPLIFALAGLSFVSYSYLDTFLIEKEYDVSFDASGNSQFSFFSSSSQSSSSSLSSSAESVSSSSKVSESSSTQTSSTSAVINPSWPSENISTNQYYENLTQDQINSLFTPEKVFVPKVHYSDSDIYVDITTERFEDYSNYYAADIRLKSTAYLKTALAQDKVGENITEKTSTMAIRHKAVLAIDGDTYGSQSSGYVIRNGQILRRTRNLSRSKPEDLAVYADGTFEVFNERDYTIDQIAAKGAWQVFSFGPGLIQNGKKIIQKGEEVGVAQSGNHNQRCAIGFISPLHYIFVVSDGRIAESPGLSLYQMGKIMEAKHAWCAYNLDGGGSATMYLDDGTGNANGLGALVNKATQEYKKDYRTITDPVIEERAVSDIVYIGKE